MLTPVDIQNKEFKKGRLGGGYNPLEVNEFLDKVLEDYQGVVKENYELKDKINMLNENIQYYRTMETTIQNALVLAEKIAQDTKSLAYQKADQIKKDAEQKAEVLLEQAKQEVYVVNNRTEELKRAYLSFKVEMKQMLQSQLEVIEEQNIKILGEDAGQTTSVQPDVKASQDTVVNTQKVVSNEIATDETGAEEDDLYYTKEFTLLDEIK